MADIFISYTSQDLSRVEFVIAQAYVAFTSNEALFKSDANREFPDFADQNALPVARQALTFPQALRQTVMVPTHLAATACWLP